MLKTCQRYLQYLCQEIPQRQVGSEGNQLANDYFQRIVRDFGWKVDETEFQALDWRDGGADLVVGEDAFTVYPSPYAAGCEVEADLVAASSVAELKTCPGKGQILLLDGELTREQLMPKNFVFYNPIEHQQIISLLEQIQPAAIISATDRNAALAGGVYPFPLIEDGDFEIPSVYLTAEEGQTLRTRIGHKARLVSRGERIPSTGSNLVAKKGIDPACRYVISAHIDAKIGTPGAIDNGTGVIVLLLLAELLQNYQGIPTIELLPFNGEDYYAASGQMIYIAQNQGRFDEIQLNINIDGAGYFEGPSAFSPFDLPPEMDRYLKKLVGRSENLILGEPWVQGDHSIFLQQGVPAIAVTSKWFLDNLHIQEITHTPRDNAGIVNCQPLIEIADLIQRLILGLSSGS